MRMFLTNMKNKTKLKILPFILATKTKGLTLEKNKSNVAKISIHSIVFLKYYFLMLSN